MTDEEAVFGILAWESDLGIWRLRSVIIYEEDIILRERVIHVG